MHRTTSALIEELQALGRSPHTVAVYSKAVEEFSHHHRKAPSDLIGEDAREYLWHLFRVKKVSGSVYHTHLCALRFLYKEVLEQPPDFGKIPRHKKGKTLPVVLSLDETGRIFETVDNLKHQTLLITAYSGGLRVSEVCHLQIPDIDSELMRIRIRNGKGCKDRYVMLAESLLPRLRKYYKACRPKLWLFPAAGGNKPLDVRTAQRVFATAKKNARIRKPASFHTLRSALT